MPNKTIEEKIREYDLATSFVVKQVVSESGKETTIRQGGLSSGEEEVLRRLFQEVYEAGYKEGARRGCRFCFSTDNR